MWVQFSKQYACFGAACGLTAWLVCGVAVAGEKIRFTDQPQKSTAPGRGLPDGFSRGFELRPSAPSDAEGAHIAPPPPNSTKARDPKMEELIDQKKNWIFSTPSRGNSDAALKQMFNVREYKFDELGGEKRSKSVIDRYFDRDSDTRKENSTKANPRGKDTDAGGRTEEPGDTRNIGGLPLEQNAKPSTSPITDLVPAGSNRRSLETASTLSPAPGDLVPRNFNAADVFGFPHRNSGSGTAPLSGQEQRLMDFRKMLGSSPVGPGLINDPINQQKDGTRQAINPIAGGASSGLGSGIDTGLTGAGAGISSIGAGRSSISDLMNSRMPGSSSLAPAVGFPSTPNFSPRPAMLEIPRRKF